MSKRLQEYVKYTKAELDSYVATSSSCVFKINSNLHFSVRPYVLSDLNTTLPAYILQHKIGYYMPNLKGVVLAVKNIKVLNGAAAIRADDPHLHIDINADCYVFRPEKGAEMIGTVKHVGKHHVGVIIYRVFHVNIRFQEEVNKNEVQLEQELRFRVKDFNLAVAHPHIQGELLSVKQESKPTKILFDSEDEQDITPDPDSGIEERDENTELAELLVSIKNEPLSEHEEIISIHSPSSPLPPQKSKQKQKATKRKFIPVEENKEQTTTAVTIKIEPGSTEKKRRRKSNESIASVSVKKEKIKIKKEKID